ncbi:unnamed protein product [Litomosoides sigmodontis]|uniref:WD repeat-containing protein 60 n=1 Tax=Litomosoides sigmodontis TaxID=42156 RepID=A0A3P6VFN8_LITSI|nr:unnamed protein product [Litomosoides sigmodontis]
MFNEARRKSKTASSERKSRSGSKSRSKESGDKRQKNDGKSKIKITSNDVREKSKDMREKKGVGGGAALKKNQKNDQCVRTTEFERLVKKNEKRIEPKMRIAIGRNLSLSNSIDKVQQSQSLRSKSVGVNPTVAVITANRHLSGSANNDVKRLKSGRSSSEKSRNAENIPENDENKAQKLGNEEWTNNYAIANYSIDKSGRASLAVKSSKSNYQNLAAAKPQPHIYFPISEALSVPSSHNHEYNYEDDFEDYSDDFEEESENDKSECSNGERSGGGGRQDEQNSKTIENLAIAPVDTSDNKSLINTISDKRYDNSPLLQRLMMSGRRSDANARPVQTQSMSDLSVPLQSKIDFTNATTINWERMAELEQRYKMLKNLIGMEIVQSDLLDHRLLCTYDFYVQTFGNANYVQVQSQTGDDALDCYVQTEELEMETVWTQIPYSDAQGWGAENTSKYTTDCYEQLADDNGEREPSKRKHFEMGKFRKFISVVGQVFLDLMQSSTSSTTKLSLQHHARFKFSKGYNKISLGNPANCAKVTHMLHHMNQLFVALYVEQTSPTTNDSDDINNQSIIVEFDICIPNIPQKISLCHNEVRCACLAPDGTSALFVGLNDGSCMAYDLRESNSLFTRKLRWHENGEVYPLRTAAYDTSFKAITNEAFDECHQFAIVAISNIPSDFNSSETYQLISVSEFGAIIIWAITNEQSTGIIDQDLGLRPGAQLKMTQTSLIRFDSIFFSNLNFAQKTAVNCMTMVPMNRTQFLIGTNRGIIANFASNKAIKLIGARIFQNDFDVATEVIDISFSVNATFFLVRVFFFSFNLHNIDMHLNATQFYAIHSDGLLLTWDLASSRKPKSIDDLNLKDSVEVTVANSWQYTTTASIAENSSTNLLAIGFSGGEVQLHVLSKLSTIVDDSNKRSDKALSQSIRLLNQ